MSILSGENMMLLQGDIEMLRNDLKQFMVTTETEINDRTQEIINIEKDVMRIMDRINYIDGYISSLSRRIEQIENVLRGRYHETKQTNNYN